MLSEVDNVDDLISIAELMIKDKPSPYVGCEVTIRGNESQAKHSKGMTGYVINVEEERNLATVSYGNDARLGKFPLTSLICLYVSFQ